METQTGTLIFTTESGIDVYDCGDYFRFTLPPTDGTTGPRWITRLLKKGIRPSKYSKNILHSLDFKPTRGITTEVAVLKGVLFVNNQHSTQNIRKFADDCSWKTPDAEITCIIWENFTDEEIKMLDMERMIVIHEPIKGFEGNLSLLSANCGFLGRWLAAFYDNSGNRWEYDSGFAFAISQTNTTQEVL